MMPRASCSKEGILVKRPKKASADWATSYFSWSALRIRPQLAPQAGKLIRNGRCRRCDLLGVMCHCNFLEKRSLITGGIFTGLSRKGPPPWRRFHEHADTSQKARRSLFYAAPVARDVLTYRELPVSGACRTDARLVGEVKDRPRKLDVPSTRKGRIVSHRSCNNVRI